jgi:NAD(P)-dependent dehydrogenase (short-subunit alcohol dehydrogenase family)
MSKASLPNDAGARPLAVITGVGPGTGSALVRRFQQGGYRVAMLARKADRLHALAQENPDAFAVPCDVSDATALSAALDHIADVAGAPQVVVHNAVGGAFGNFLAIDPAVMNANFQVNVMALLHLARWAAPLMQAAGAGAILVTGNTAAQRGRANFAGFAPTKAAQRILAESMARELGPQGIHVAYLLIDAVIDVPWARKRYPEHPDDFFIRPADIADELWHVAHQPRSAWSFLTELRPFNERW